MARSLRIYIVLVALMLCTVTAATAAQEHLFPSDLMRPPTGVYSSGPGIIYWSQGIVLQNIAVSNPLASFSPPPLLTTATHTFGCLVTGQMSVNGGAWFAVTVPATATIRSFHSNDVGDISYFSEEILGLNMSWNTPYGPAMIRESPTLQSTGQATIRPDPDEFMISSFFDVFVELSLDGGQTWQPSISGPTRLDLMPEPSALISLLAGVVAFAGFRRFRK